MSKLSGWAKLPKMVRSGYLKELAKDGPLSLNFVNWIKHKVTPWSTKELSRIVAKKGAGKGAQQAIKETLKKQRYKPLTDKYMKYVGAPVAKADANLGAKAMKGTEKIFGKGTAKALFEDTKILPVKNAKGVFTGRQEVKMPSITAPATKAGKFVIPMLGFAKAQELLEKRKMNKNANITKADLQKTAAMLRSLKDQRSWLEKQARATLILFKQAELGQIEFPKTAAVYTEKIAELVSKDLNIVEEAIKLASPNLNSFGDLAGDASKGSSESPQDQFKQSLMTDF